jgi:multicomponent Na+:H+ antiporter subunit A
MTLTIYLWLPALLAVAVLILGGTVRRLPHVWAVGLALVGLGGAAAALGSVSGGGFAGVSQPWVESLGVSFALQAGSFRALFLALICGIGAAVFLFTAAAFRDDRRLPGLLATLLLFTASMIGVVVSDDLLLLFLFWEGTSLLSFVLIGWNHGDGETRRKATQAFLVTALGGLALLAGLILLRIAGGSGTLSGLAGADLGAHPWAAAIIVLVGLGALTKSAQFPFHFWLPNAMAGPTPVSAFLHSATMVKAGVFLLAVLAPTLGSHPLWMPLLLSCGLATIAVAVARAWRESDLKALLASTTLAALGHLTILAGIGTAAALQAFVVFLVAHALYKAPLFLATGTLEKAFGSRDFNLLRGTAFRLPLVGAALLLSFASLLGLVPLPGFVAKEYALKAAWAQHPALAIALAASFSAVIALGIRAALPLFARSGPAGLVKRPAAGMAWAPLLPALGALVLTVAFPWISASLLGPAATSLGAETGAKFALWPGLGPVLVLSFVALGAGLLAGLAPRRFAAAAGERPADRIYQASFDRLAGGGRRLASLLQDRRVRDQVAIVFVAAGMLISVPLVSGGLLFPEFRVGQDMLVSAMLGIVAALAATGAARARRRVELLSCLGLLGLVVAMFYSYFSAPDLALTQLLTETILILLLVPAVRRMARGTIAASRRPAYALPVAILGGSAAAAVVLKAKALQLTPPVSGFFTENSMSQAFGANVVNVILVDFRAIDTLGEIIVLGIAAIGAIALLRRARPVEGFDPASSPLLATSLRLLVPTLGIFALFLFLRGHNQPGGGFIAALVAATAVGFVHLSGKPSPRGRRLELLLVIAGISVAVLSGMLPLATGKPLLTGLWLHPSLPGSGSSLHLGTPLLFDLGVFLAVLGFALAFIRRLLVPTPPQVSWN